MNSAIGFWQRAYVKERDRQELIFCLKTAIDDFKHISSKFFAVFVDFRDAFGSLSQSYMIQALLESGIAKQYCEIVADIYTDSHFQVICHNQLSKEFPLSVGAKTGCPLSALLFVVSLDKSLKEIHEHAVRSLNIRDESRISPLPVAGYADDIAFVSLNEKLIKEMVQNLVDSTSEAGLIIRPDKCAIFYERRSGNRWYKAKNDREPEIRINNEKIQVYKRHESFTYLGKPLTVAGEEEKHVQNIIKTYSDLLDHISACLLPLALKLEALESVALSKIQHHFANTAFTEDQLQDLDKLLTSFLRNAFHIHNNTTVRTLLQKKQIGGLGVRKPSRIYRITRVSHLVNMLNNVNDNFKYIARHSLELDMKKRGVRRSAESRNFLGFACDESGKLQVNIKGGFGVSSDWPHLCRLVRKLDVELTWEYPEEHDLMLAGNAQITFNCEKSNTVKVLTTRQKIRNELLERMLHRELRDLKELPMQGRLIDIPGANYLLSQNIYRNYKIKDDLISFWYKAKHNVLPCNYTLSIWYPGQSPACAMDGYRLESMSHILNGCTEFRNNYVARHDRIIEKISSEIPRKSQIVYINKTIQTCFADTVNPNECGSALKPDFIVRRGTTVMIMDVACPYDLYIHNAYQEKIRKYKVVQSLLNSKGFNCVVDSVIIGSLGSVHCKALGVLMNLEIKKLSGKGLLKWCSTSNIIAAKQLWNLRC